jgi:hypothetical protein
VAVLGCVKPDGTTISITTGGVISTVGGGAVSSVSNADGTLTITPTSGAVVASLNLGHANTWTATQTFALVKFSGVNGTTVLQGSGILDQSAIPANPSTFFTACNTAGGRYCPPAPFPVWPGTTGAVVTSVNRLMVGDAATHTNTGCHTGGSVSWALTTFGGNCDSAQISTVSILGTEALEAFARTSDYAAWGNVALAPNTEAINSFALCDSTTTFGDGPAICAPYFGVAWVNSGANSVGLGVQFDLSNGDASVVNDPFDCCGGTHAMMGVLLTSGGYPLATQNDTAALVIAPGNPSGGPYWNAGIIITTQSVTTGAGPTINGTASTMAIVMPDNYYIVWESASNVGDAALWAGTAHKMNIFGNAGVNIISGGTAVAFSTFGGGLSIDGTAGVTCGAGVSGGATRVISGLVTTC